MLSSFLERIAHFFTCFVDFLLNVFTEVLNLVFPLVDNFLAVFGELFELFIEFVELLIELFLYDHEQAYACQECLVRYLERNSDRAVFELLEGSLGLLSHLLDLFLDFLRDFSLNVADFLPEFALSRLPGLCFLRNRLFGLSLIHI